MLRKLLTILFISGLCYIIGGNRMLYADGDAAGEVVVPHPMVMYPGAVQSVNTDSTAFLTKDNINVVKKFFETHKHNGDRMEPFQIDNTQGYIINYYAKIGGREQFTRIVEFETHLPDTNIHPAIGELKLQVAMGKHSEADYQTQEQKYKHLHLCFFRLVDDGQGGTISEGEKIYRKTYNQVHNQETTSSLTGQDPAKKAQAQDMRRQMQEMKAKGDLAGIMNMAQNSNKSPRQTSAGAAAIDSATRDTWDLWEKCLRDMDAVAYRTSLKYTLAPVAK